jgi:NADH dehydrogenase FAD-containing subunit
VKVNPDLSLPGHPEVFAIGDMALVLQENGKPVPGVSPAAMQMARHVARIIENELALGPGQAPRPAFKYWDRGTMATIGRSAAVADRELKISGWIAARVALHPSDLLIARNKPRCFCNGRIRICANAAPESSRGFRRRSCPHRHQHEPARSPNLKVHFRVKHGVFSRARNL